MNEEFKTKEATSELVPHKGKMLLLDRVQNYSLEDVNITTEIDISRNSLFYEDDLGGIPAWVAFEYMAQSISALSGIYGRTKGDKPKVGFIMSVSGFKADIPVFKDGETVVVTVHETVRMDKAVTFDGVAKVGDKIAVIATLNTVEVDDPKATLGMN
ncbi:thioester dehydrase [Fibrobacter sp. UWB13]|uniref:ApeP family dehydratase n=1 Tax=Fibrobacter sp. UWB13 TaxID=1896204 RepID=UPI000A0DFAE3|nr:thioester dehydrase [Fibrobacter sp. UWB13]SMG12000.1 Predicted 3-hydroxylacyl-ACP dehydratase, HotDog domain [Fibrobacter sp. UWB13]